MVTGVVNIRRGGKYLFHLWLTVSSFVTVIGTCFPSKLSFISYITRYTFRHESCATRLDTSHVPHVSTRAMCHKFRHEPCVTRFDTSHVPLVSTRAMIHTSRHEPCATRFDTSHVPHVATRAMCHTSRHESCATRFDTSHVPHLGTSHVPLSDFYRNSCNEEENVL